MPKNRHVNNMTHHFEQLFDLITLLDSSNITESDDPTVVDTVQTHLQSIIDCSSAGIHAVGSLLGTVEHGKLQNHDLQDVGRLLAMLGELIKSSQSLRNECQHALVIMAETEDIEDMS